MPRFKVVEANWKLLIIVQTSQWIFLKRICISLNKILHAGQAFDNLWKNSLRADEYVIVGGESAENCSSFSYFHEKHLAIILN